ncbi:hypothetical protein, variant [Verruconis gallopava]|nr:hypothetical protein, variant [Verruconis gallopava]KIW06030.1 hypothetical protein, variant [Verruconis gallopava]
MLFATIMTQILARSTNMLDSRHKLNMNKDVYMKAIFPIGFFFSLSLIFGNKAYLYLSVAFIQMLKATNPVVVLLITWGLGYKPFDGKTLANVSVIVIGVIIASYGEIKFVLAGFICQALATGFEATRLVLIERLLSAYKMDALVSLYYYAPVCTVMNLAASLYFESPTFSWDRVTEVGYFNMIANAGIAFLLNVSLVLLIGKTSSLVLTLCGVLKDILLVVASILIWGTPVTATQFFGYSIALGGLVHYKLGAEAIKNHIMEANRNWQEFGQKKPAAKQGIIIGTVVLTIFIMAGGLAPSFAYRSGTYVKSLLGGSQVSS